MLRSGPHPGKVTTADERLRSLYVAIGLMVATGPLVAAAEMQELAPYYGGSLSLMLGLGIGMAFAVGAWRERRAELGLSAAVQTNPGTVGARPGWARPTFGTSRASPSGRILRV